MAWVKRTSRPFRVIIGAAALLIAGCTSQEHPDASGVSRSDIYSLYPGELVPCHSNQDASPDQIIAGCTAVMEVGDLGPQDLMEARSSRAEAYAKTGAFALAIRDYDEVLRLNPRSLLALTHRGAAYLAQAEYGRALDDLNRAISLYPDTAEAYNYRGGVFYCQHQYDRAIEDEDRAIGLDPKLAAAFNGRGLAYEAKGDHDRAIQDYDQAISLAPK